MSYESTLGRVFHPRNFQGHGAWPTVQRGNGRHVQPETFSVLVGIRRITAAHCYALDDDRLFSSPKYNVVNLAVDCNYQTLLHHLIAWLPRECTWPVPRKDSTDGIGDIYLARLRSSPTITPTSLSSFTQVAYDHICPVDNANIWEVLKFLKHQTSDLFILSVILSTTREHDAVLRDSQAVFSYQQAGDLEGRRAIAAQQPSNAPHPVYQAADAKGPAQRNNTPAPTPTTSQRSNVQPPNQRAGIQMPHQQQIALPSARQVDVPGPHHQNEASDPSQTRPPTRPLRTNDRSNAPSPTIGNRRCMPKSLEDSVAAATTQVLGGTTVQAQARTVMADTTLPVRTITGEHAGQTLMPEQRARMLFGLPNTPSNSTDRRRSTGGSHVMDEMRKRKRGQDDNDHADNNGDDLGEKKTKTGES